MSVITLLIIRLLYDVEHAFRTLKTTLDLKPNYHIKHERIFCHIFLCFIALVLVRMSENAIQKSGGAYPARIESPYSGEFKFENKMVARLTELTNVQKSIFLALGIAAPSSVVYIDNS